MLGASSPKNKTLDQGYKQEGELQKAYTSDIELILSHRYDLGADFWTTPDKRLLKGSPFSTLGSAMLLLELGMDAQHEVLQAVAELIFSTWQQDGRYRLAPTGAVYPCQTAHAANVLAHLGYASDPRMQKTFAHLLEIQYHDGGWRCNKFSFGRGVETESSNPFPTLTVLDAFRFRAHDQEQTVLNRAVQFLLGHWESRLPLGPCHYGMGTRFMQVEYPFGNYNLFLYVYVLSFYAQARKDARFLEALRCLEQKCSEGQIVVERIHRQLAGLTCCKKGQASTLATARFDEIKRNLQTAHA